MKTDIVRVVGSTIRRLREERGFSQEAFAQHAQLDRAFYGKIERGTQNIALTTLCAVARGLDVAPVELLRDVSTSDCSLPATFNGEDEVPVNA